MNTYDLHGLRIVQAAARLPLIIEEETSAGNRKFRILVGKGTGALALFVEEFLIDSSYNFSILSEGLFEVSLARKDNLY